MGNRFRSPQGAVNRRFALTPFLILHMHITYTKQIHKITNQTLHPYKHRSTKLPTHVPYHLRHNINVHRYRVINLPILFPRELLCVAPPPRPPLYPLSIHPVTTPSCPWVYSALCASGELNSRGRRAHPREADPTTVRRGEESGGTVCPALQALPRCGCRESTLPSSNFP